MARVAPARLKRRQRSRRCCSRQKTLLQLGVKTLSSGPIITGSILPEKRADLRAEVSAVVLTVFKENGDPVKKGQLLVQLDDTSIRDTLSSARTAAEIGITGLSTRPSASTSAW